MFSSTVQISIVTDVGVCEYLNKELSSILHYWELGMYLVSSVTFMSMIDFVT